MQSETSIARLEGLLYRSDAGPAYWIRDVRRRIDSQRATMTNPDLCAARDLRKNRTPEEARRLSQRLIRCTGELYEAWSGIVEAARALGEPGRRMSVNPKDA